MYLVTITSFSTIIAVLFLSSVADARRAVEPSATPPGNAPLPSSGRRRHLTKRAIQTRVWTRLRFRLVFPIPCRFCPPRDDLTGIM